MAKREGTRRDGSVDVRKALMTPVGGGKGDWAQIAITIPKAHLRVLETEAQLLGLRRGQLLELLFLAKIGQRALTRIPAAPTYKLRRDELAETERFIWYCRAEVKGLLADYLLKLGMRPSAFVVLMLNEWAGLGPEASR